MAELGGCGQPLDRDQISIVWSAADWPGCTDGPLTQPGQADFQLDGVCAIDLRHARYPYRPGVPIGQLLDGLLTDSAKACVDAGTHGISVFGRRVRAAYVVQPGDRIELCGPVSADPKAARHQRVASEREKGRSVWKR